jgi:Carbohydrate family 9 binding domain-like
MMDHRRPHFRNLNLILALGCAFALGGLACGSSRPKADGGSGGAGGGAGSGGAGGSGGTTVPTGGSDAAQGGQGGGGAGGAGGNTGPSVACQTDAECAASNQFCEPAKKLCVQCTKSAECPAGGHCLGNTCVTMRTACTDSLDCAAGTEVCDTTRGLCVQCAKDADCTTGQSCVSNQCVAVAACQTSLDCGNKVCDSGSKKCVDCAGDNDCNAPGATSVQHCIANVCKPECTSDKQCTAQGMLCNTTTKVCAQCKTNADCPASTYCDFGLCKADICDSTQAMCVGNNVSPCNAAGNGWGPLANCPADKACKAYGGAAACGGVAGVDGGATPPPPVDGGSGSIDGSMQGCSSGTSDPCKTGMPKYTGTQTVDGKGDDMCSLPSFQFTAATAAKLLNYNNVPLSQFETPTIWVGWSPSGFHLFVDVLDSSVQTVNMADPSQAIAKAYQGDSIELFITANNNVTGLTSTDANALHVIIPANGPAVSVKTDNSSGASSGKHTELPQAQYKQAVTATGYAIEALLPWPGGTPPNTGTTMRFDIGLNSADKNFGTVDDMRDGQMLFYVGTVSGNTTCQSGDGTVPFCDDRTWCPSQTQ